MLKKGDKSQAVKDLQRKLVSLGYPLPRFGADGVLGDETFDALNSFLAAYKDLEGVALDRVVSLEEERLVERIWLQRAERPSLPPRYQDHTHNHPMPKPQWCHYRGWSEKTGPRGITWHQTACVLGETPARWYSVPVHFGITRKGEILHLNPVDWNLPHGNALNAMDIGVEIDGHFEGIKGDLKTYWRPKEDPTRQPLSPTDAQVESAHELARWLVAEVASHGGKIRYLHAHRQGSDQRQSDPGSEVWQRIALPHLKELGLSDGGVGWVAGKGMPLPDSWTLQNNGIKY